MTAILQALLKASKKQDLKITKKKEKKEVVIFDERILVNGGVSQYTFEYEGKKKVVLLVAMRLETISFQSINITLKMLLVIVYLLKLKIIVLHRL